jgi:hypothetical protein
MAQQHLAALFAGKPATTTAPRLLPTPAVARVAANPKIARASPLRAGESSTPGWNKGRIPRENAAGDHYIQVA